MIKISDYYFSLLQYHKEYSEAQEKINKLLRKGSKEEAEVVINSFEVKWKEFLLDKDISDMLDTKQYSQSFLTKEEMLRNSLQ